MVRLGSLACFVLAFAWASSAAAATSVPMCGMYGQTIAAPPIGTPASSDSVSANDGCQVRDLLRAAGVPQRDAPEKHASSVELPPRALPVQPRFPEREVSSRTLLPTAAREHLPPGFARLLDRPPRG